MEHSRNSGKAWAEKLNIPILDPKGWNSIGDYESRLITRAEFCNRAAASVLKVEHAATRREAAAMMQKTLARRNEPRRTETKTT